MESMYNDIVKLVVASGDESKMHTLAEASGQIYQMLQDNHPDIAAKWLDMLEPIRWHNYLSEAEARDIVSRMGSDGVSGEILTADQVTRLSGDRPECEPAYNRWALYTTANMMMHDHGATLTRMMGDSAQGAAVDLAREWLTDYDRPDKVRWYWHL